MNTSLIPTRALDKNAGPTDWKFLNGLIDVEDLENGSFDVYTNLTNYHAFVLKKERVGFEGGFGLKTYGYVCDNEKCLEFVLWPYMPARDTRQGYIDVFDPKPILKLIWRFGTYGPAQEVTGLNCVEVELKNRSMNTKSVEYALKILTRARELWPPDQK